MSETHDPGPPGSPGADQEADPLPESSGLGFRQAMEELEGILERIEGEEIDIDQLAQELRRAAQLLDLCRGKIRKAEIEVTQIVQSLEAGDESAGGGEEEGRPAPGPGAPR